MKRKLLLLFSLMLSGMYAALAQTYCVPTVTNVANYGIGITNVTMGSINNTTSTASAPPVYFDYTDQFTASTVGSTVNFSVTLGPSNSTAVAIYVDWNKDGTFNTTYGSEYMWVTSATTAGSVQSGSFAVPSVSPGVYRMRVGSEFGGMGTPPGPCSSNYGEYEDYSFIVRATTGIDAGAYAFAAPATFVGGNNTITLRWINFANTTITTADLGYNVDGGTATTQTFSGSLAAGGVTTTTFSTQMNLANGTHTIKAWVRNPNSTYPDAIVGNDTITRVVTVCTPLSGTYTIDPAGSGSTNFLTFSAAVTALATCGVGGPVTFNVASATFNEQISIPSITGASATNTITFNGGSGNAATRILQYNFASLTNYAVVDLNSAKYVTFKNITVKTQSTTYGWGFLFRNQANYNTIDSCVIDMSAATSGTNTNVLGICISNSPTSATINGNNMNYCNITNNTIKGGTTGGAYRGIHFYGSTSNTTDNTNNIIRNNVIQDFYESGIYCYFYMNNLLIKGNDISRPNRNSSTTLYGIQSYYFMNRSLDGNKIHNLNGGQTTNANAVYGISDYYGYNSPASTASNNAIYDIVGTGTHYGIYVYYSTYSKYYFNTVSFNNASTHTGTIVGIYNYEVTSGVTNTEFKNNNVSVTRPGGIRYGFQVQDAANYTADYNNYYVNGTGSTNYIGSYNGGALTSLAALKAIYAPQDANTLSIDPQFTNITSDLTPQNCALNGSGITISGITLDITGATRAASPDIGAYEFNVSGVDAGITALVAPTGFICSTGSQNITVTLKNFSSTTLTSDSIRWWVNGTAQTTYAWTGSLSPGASTSVTIGTINFAAATTYNVSVKATLPNGSTDACGANDSAGYVLGIGLSGTFTINPSGGTFTSFNAAITALKLFGLCGPVVFNVAAATYNEQISIPAISGASATNTITFNGGNGNAASRIISFSYPSAANYGIVDLNGADYITFKNITVKSTNPNYGWGFLLRNQADYNTIDSCIIDLGLVTTTGSNSIGICFSGSTTSYSTNGNHANFCTITNNTILGSATGGAYFGISLYGSTSNQQENKRILISKNSIQDFYYNGIYTYFYADSMTVSGNDISRPNRTNSTTLYGINYGYYAINRITENNKIHNLNGGFTGNGNTIYGLATQYSFNYNNIYRNNAIYDIQGAGPVYGIYDYYCYGDKIYHNTVSLDNSTATNGVVYGIYYYAGTTVVNGQDFKNNIVTISKPGVAGTGTRYGFYSQDNSNYPADNNIYLITSTSSINYYGYYSGVNYPTFANWQARNIANEQNSLSVNPSYTNLTSNLAPTNCAANNTGAAVGVTTDINGATRSGSIPDAGAYEVNLGGTNDIGITMATISGLTAGVCSGTATVTATIRNYGSAALTSATINWTVNASSQTAYSFSGSLASGASTVITLGTFSINPGTMYTVVATGSSPNSSTDACSGNDSYTVVGGSGMSGTYTINPSGTGTSNYSTFTAAVNDLNLRGVCGPVVINVSAGTYTEQISIPQILGSSATNYITFKSTTGLASSVIVTFNSPSTANYLVDFNGADYIKFQSMTFNSINTTYGIGMQFRNVATRDSVVGCTFNGIITTTVGTNLALIFASGTNDSVNTFIGNTFNNGSYGMYYVGTSTVTKVERMVISGNTFAGQYASPIYLNYADRTQILGNTITNASLNTTNYMVYNTNALNGFRIENNKLNVASVATSGTYYGIYNTVATTPSPITDSSLIANNEIIMSSATQTLYGIYQTSTVAAYSRVYNNSVLIGAAGTATSYAGYFSMTTGNSRILNNVFINRRTGTTTAWALYKNSDATTISNYNLLYSAGTNLASNGTSYTTLAAWNASTNTPDLNSFSKLPYFSNPSSLVISEGCFDNKGTPNTATVNTLASVSKDITGANRGATPDFGAYEFSGNAYDLAVTAVTSPATYSASPQTVTFRVRNNGSTAITAFDAGYNVNGGTNNNETFTIAALNGCDSTTLSFTNQVTMPSGVGMISLAAFVRGNLNGSNADVVRANDTAWSNPVCNGGLSGTYTINNSIPASNKNFVSFTSAIASLTTCGVNGPVTFNVAAGTYNEQVTIPQVTGVSATNTITFDGGAGNAASRVVQYNFASTPHYGVVRLNGADYIRLKNLTVKTLSTTIGWGILINNANTTTVPGNPADNNIIDNCIIDLSLTTSASTTINGIVFNASPTSVSSGGNHSNNTVISNNFIKGSALGGAYYGIYLYGYTSGSGYNKNIQILNNTIQDFYSSGIYTQYYYDGMIISGNDISRPNRTTSTTLYGIYTYLYFTNSIVERNKIHNMNGNFTTNTNTLYGIYDYYGTNSQGNNIVRNNAIYDIQGSGQVFGIYSYYNWGKVMNNTISLDNTLTTYTGTMYGIYYYTGNIGTTSYGQELKNNIISMTKPGGTRYGIYVADNSVNSIDYNSIWVNGVGSTNYIGYWQPTGAAVNYPTFASWQARNSTLDQNSYNVNPSFTSLTSDPTPTNCLLDNAALVSVSVPNDMNGVTRSSAPDFGAYEFSASGANNASITALTSPTGVVCSGTQNVIATLKNKGTATLTTAKIDWTVNGTPQTQYSWSGSLAPGATANVTIGTLNFTTNASYALKVYSSLPNGATDGCGFDDTLMVTKGSGMSGAYTIDAAGSGSTNFTSFTNAITAMSTFGICGPVTFTVAAGTYNGQLVIPVIPGSSALNTVTFDGGTGNATTRVITYTNTGTSYAGIQLDGADYIRFQNLTIKSLGTGNNMGILFNNSADYNMVDNCIVDLSSVSFGVTSACVSFSSAPTSFTGTASHGNYNIVKNSVLKGGASGGPYYGINMYFGNTTNAGSKYNSFINNDITDFYYVGIYHYYGMEGNSFTDNRISRPTMTASNSTVYGVYDYYYGHNTNISRNRIFNPFGGMPGTNNTFFGIYTYVNNATTPYMPCVVANNAIYNINTNGPVYGIYGYNNYDTKVLYNTIVLDSSNSGSASSSYGLYFQYMYSSGTVGSPNIVRNNIVYLTRPGSANNAALYIDNATSSTLPQVDNNIYYVGGGSNNYFVYYTSTATFINSLATWKSSTTPNSYDANSISVNPQFVSMATGNLKPTNTAANNTAANLGTLVMNDINQNPRSATPDAGAYEWGPTCAGFPTVNGVTMLSTGQPICPGTAAQLAASYDVADSLTFQWQESPDGTNWSNVSGGSGANTGIYTTPGITAPKYYRCKVTCTVSGSSSFSTSFMVRNALSGTYTINGGNATSGTNYNSFADVLTDLRTFGVCGNVTFNVAAGTYNEQVIMGSILGLSSSSQITFNGLGTSTVVASTITNTTDYGVIHLNGTDYVTFNNLTVKADNPNQGFGFLLSNGADYVTIKNCNIDMSSVSGTGTASAGICVSSSFTAYSGGGINANYLTIEGNRITGSASGGAYFGISLYDNTTGSGRNVNNIIKNNYIADFYVYGIYAYYGKDNLLITGNTITRPNRPAATTLYGIYAYYTTSASPLTIEKNRIVNFYNGSGTGTFYGIYGYSPTSYMNYITNNIIHPGVTGGAAVTMYGVYLGTVYALAFDHNTIVMSDTNSSNTSARYGAYLTGPPGASATYPYEIRNNLIHMTTPGGTSYGWYFANNTTVTAYNYAANYNNLWVEPFGGVGTKYYAYLGGNLYASHAAWKTNAWGYDLNGTNSDALFNSTFTPSNALIDNLGAPTSSLRVAVTTDINNKVRKPATPDMGAVEWTPICVGADFVQGTPYQGTFRSGTAGDFDHLKAGNTVTYDVLPITGYTNASFGTAWTISNFSFATLNGSPAGSGQATLTNPGSGNGTFSFSPSQPYTDSTFLITFDIKSVTGAECITPISRYIYVAPVPVVDFDTTAVACYTSPSTIKNNTTLINGNMTFLWNFGDTTSNNTSIQGTPTYTFSHPGSFSVTLTATSDLGYSNTKTKTMNVYYLPQAKYDFQPGCLGNAIAFNNQSTIPGPPVSLSHSWNFGDNTSSSSTSPSKTYTAIGTYNVTLTTTSAQGCSTSVTKNVTVFPVPVVNFTATNPCQGENATFSNGTTIAYGKLGYSWNFGDGTTDIVSDPVKNYTNQGTYNVKMVAYSEYGCKDSITKSVTIGTVPTAAFALTKWCDNDSASFSNSSTANGGPSITSSWSFGDLTSSNSSASVIKHMYPSAGMYHVMLVVTNGACSDTAESHIDIEETPMAYFSVSGGVCQGNATTFNNLSTGVDTLSYSWNFDGTGTSTAMNPTYTFSGAGSFNVVLNVNSSNGCSNSFTKSVSVFTQPSAAFNTSWNTPFNKRQQAFYAGNQNLYSYNWNFGDNIGTSQQVNPVYSYFSNGPFTVKLKVSDANGCTNEHDTIIDFIKLSAGNMNNNAFSFDVYPNPFRGNTTVNYTLERAGEVEVKVYDITGKEITTLVNATKQEVGSYKVNFDASAVNAKSGIYFIRLSVDGVVVSKQVIETK